MTTKTWKVVLVFAGVFAAGVVTGATWSWRFGRPGPEERPRWAGPGFGNRMMERMREDLNLTDEQKARLEPIVQRSDEELQTLRRGQLQEVAQIMDRVHAEVAAVLTPDQRTKLEEMRERFRQRAERMRREFREHREGRGFGEGHPGFGPPPELEPPPPLPPPPREREDRK